MKKTLLLLATASLVTAQISATKDVVKAAIKAHDAYLLMQVLPLQYNGDAKLKAELEKVAQEEVTKKAAEVATRFKFSRFYNLEGISALASGMAAIGFALVLYDKYKSMETENDRKEKVSQLWTVSYLSAVVGNAANLFRSSNDLAKNIATTRAKHAENLKKAKTVLRVIQALPIRTAQVSA